MKYLTLLGRGAGVFGVGACLFATSGLIAACSSDDSAAPSTSADASSGADGQPSTPEPDAATPVADAGDELITEGGGLLPEDPDAGPDDDAGIDAGPACGTVAVGTFGASKCSNRLTLLTGGALTTTKYVLKSVVVLGSSTFCASTFVSYEHRGGLTVTASSASAATFELWDVYRKAGSLKVATNYRYDAQVVATGAQLAVAPAACAAKPAPATASYSVGTDNGKKALTLRLPYGAGSALYHFVEP